MATKEYHRAWRKKNLAKRRAIDKRYYDNNAGKVRAKVAAWRADHPDKVKDYSVAPERKASRRAATRRWMAKRGGFVECTDYPAPPTDSKCSICHREARLCLDHDHETGRFRGYLCAECNMGLGKLGDSIEAIRRVLTYLERGDA